MAPMRSPIGSSLHRRSRACASRRSNTSRPWNTFASSVPASTRRGPTTASAPAVARALPARVRNARRSRGESPIAFRIAWSGALGRAPRYLLGQGPMLGTADDGEVRPGAGRVDQPPDGAAPALPRRDVQDSELDIAADLQHGLVARLGAAADQREVAAGAEEPSGRFGDAPARRHRGHLEIVAHDEAVEAQSASQEPRDDLG